MIVLLCHFIGKMGDGGLWLFCLVLGEGPGEAIADGYQHPMNSVIRLYGISQGDCTQKPSCDRPLVSRLNPFKNPVSNPRLNFLTGNHQD